MNYSIITIRKHIHNVLSSTNEWMTCVRICNAEAAGSVTLEGTAVSSILCKMFKEGGIRRKKGVGPKGGYGYRLVEKLK